jgi:hypothetical protein
LLELNPVDVESELGFPWSATRDGESAAVEGDEAKLPEVRKRVGRNAFAFILKFHLE